MGRPLGGKASPSLFSVTIASRVWRLLSKNAVNRGFFSNVNKHFQCKVEGKYSLESTDPRAPRQLTITLKLSYYLFIIATLFKVKDGFLKFVIPAKARDYVFTGVGLFVCLFVTTVTK